MIVAEFSPAQLPEACLGSPPLPQGVLISHFLLVCV